MDRLSSHRATKEVVNKHNFKFSKSLGQNFLIDDNVIDRILEGARLSETDRIIEVGPGIGTLTREMGKVAENVVAIEIDKTLIPILKETLADLDNVEVVNEDILKVDVQGLINEKLKTGQINPSSDAFCETSYVNFPFFMVYFCPLISNDVTFKVALSNTDASSSATLISLIYKEPIFCN